MLTRLLVTTGMRRSEIVDLTWEQIDLDSNTVIVHGKGNKERLFPLHPMVISLIHKYRDGISEEHLHRIPFLRLKAHILKPINYPLIPTFGFHEPCTNPYISKNVYQFRISNY
jgi:integrase